MHPDILSHYASRYDKAREEEYTIQEYLEICKRDHSAYATASERMLLVAIGEPELVDTRHDQRFVASFPTRSSRFTLLSASSMAPKRC
jgi:serine protein kinase